MWGPYSADDPKIRFEAILNNLFTYLIIENPFAHRVKDYNPLLYAFAYRCYRKPY